MKLIFSYRGDNRDAQAVKQAGGFVPKYLLATHIGGLDGFIACGNKVDGKMGCTCASFGEGELYNRARQKLLEVVRNPSLLQEHVIWNKLGYLATATVKSDAYESAHKYKIVAEFDMDLPVADARVALGVENGRRLTNITEQFRILMNSKQIQNATLFAATPHQGIELTFLSPVPSRYIAEF